MTIRDQILSSFATKVSGTRPISGCEGAYTYINGYEYGVAIECSEDLEISESSANAKICTMDLIMNSHPQRLIILLCFDESYRISFASLCEQFLSLGENGSNRELVLNEPLKWWNKWIGLLGNKKTRKQCYSTIVEMLALDLLYQNDKSVVWAADHAGSHDIETNTCSFEVKSSIKKSGVIITISSQHQLMSNKPLELYFGRVEESLLGVSINDVKKQLVLHGYDPLLIEEQLSSFGFERGSSIRDVKYKVLEKRKYQIDETFPKITKNSFKGDVFPQCVTHITYDIDIEGLPYTTW